MAGEARDEEATWRDLVAQYSTPAADGAVPWPVREDLSGARPVPPGATAPADPPGSTDTPTDKTDERGASTASGTPRTGDPGPADPPADGEDPGAARPPEPGWDPVPGVIPVQPPTRIVRPAAPAPIPPAGDDEHYVPPAPPPLPRLDPVSKGAWTALFGGPGYLLLAVLLGWVVPSWAAFCAVAAFVGGFATLVVRMGDRPPDDPGSDDGAVV
jgi:hypothetical protein